jgi:Dihydrodipicolinate synthetase family
MLYNNPFTTGVNLDAATLAAFGRDVENIKYVKASSKDWEQALRIIHHHRDDIGLIMGWDSYSFSALLKGAVEVMAGNHVAFGFGPAPVRWATIGARRTADCLPDTVSTYPHATSGHRIRRRSICLPRVGVRHLLATGHLVIARSSKETP